MGTDTAAAVTVAPAVSKAKTAATTTSKAPAATPEHAHITGA
ncbi:MAG: hypothetical protein ACREL3_04470 [Gemmatimonadales bacterium]